MPKTKDSVHEASSSKHHLKTILTSIESIPTAVLQEILSRLPARQVPSLRLVCRFWKTSISNTDFLELHRKRSRRDSNPTEILILTVDWRIFTINDTGYKAKAGSQDQGSQKVLTSGIVLCTFQFQAWRNAASGSSSSSSSLGDAAIRLASSLSNFLSLDKDYNAGALCDRLTTSAFMSFSALGFIVFSHYNLNKKSTSCVILNPLTKEKVTLMIGKEDATLDGQVYGLFHHPTLSHTCVLWGKKSGTNTSNIEFKVLDLGSSRSRLDSPNIGIGECSCWRDVIPRLHRHHPRRYRHSYDVIPPVISNNVLYWMLDEIDITCKEAILAFDVQQEKFETLPHPHPHPHPDSCSRQTLDPLQKHKSMHLLQTSNGILSLCEFSTSLLQIWVRDSSEKSGGGIWIRKHTFTDNGFFSSLRSKYDFRPIGMVNEETVLVEEDYGGWIWAPRRFWSS